MRIEFPAIGGGMIVIYKVSNGRVSGFEVFGEISAKFKKYSNF